MSSVAIVGMACEYPDARSPVELWENVLARRRAFRRMPSERMCLSDYFSPDRNTPDSTYATRAAVIEGYEFDRVRFRVAGSTYRAVDPAHWLALDVAARALQDAGFADGEGLPREMTGVLLGNTLTGDFSRAATMRLRWPYVRRVVDASLRNEGWTAKQVKAFLESLEAQYKAPFPPVGEESLPGGMSNTIAGRICNYFDLKGGGYTVDGACASSLLAVANACAALVSGDLDVALAGGVDLSLDPFEIVGFAKMGALASEDMRVYDARSAGFWPGEGCGFVVLMRHEDAVRQQRRIYAVVKGWGISSDGGGGITRPEVDGQILALQRAYHRAGFGIESVAYFEGHGTGTEVGDATELRTLSRALRQAGVSAPAAIGSIKANIGHTKAAAGVAGLIKATMSLHTQVLPPTTGSQEPHPEMAGDSPALRVLNEGAPWPADRPLRAAVSAMGFGGINTHLVLEGVDATRSRSFTPLERSLLSSSQDSEVFLMGAQDAAGLLRQVEHLLSFAAQISLAEMSDLAAEMERRLASPPHPGPLPPGERKYVLTSEELQLDAKPIQAAERGKKAPSPSTGEGGDEGEASHQSRLTSIGNQRVRASVVASNPDELASCLETLRSWLASGETARLDAQAGVYLGTGDATPRIGFLFPGQGSPVNPEGGAWRRRFDYIRELYAGSAAPTSGVVTATHLAQPAIVAASLAGLRVLNILGIEGSIAVGHSLGELTALHWAGAMDEAALMRIVRARGKAMAELGSPEGAMASIGAGRREVEELLVGDSVVISALNSSRQTVVSGAASSVAEVIARAQARGLKAIRLPVSHAFHSPLVAQAAPALAKQLDREELRPLRRDVVSTVTGAPLDPNVDIRDLLVRQVTHPVRFARAMALADEDVSLWIEVGPGHVLTSLAGDSISTPAIALDAGGPGLKGLLNAIGAAYALGASVNHRALFADRFTRPFNLDWRPRFLANPCEQAPVAINYQLSAISTVPTEREASGVRGQVSDSSSMDSEPRTPDPAHPLEVVRRLVAEWAELPLAAVTDDSHLLSDLHMNSIAVGEVVARAARSLGLAPPVAPTDYADATVAKVASALEELARTGGSAPAAEQDAMPAGVDSWVRAFKVELVERPIPRSQNADGPGDWRIVAPSDHPMREPLREAFARSGKGRGVVVCLPPEADEGCIRLLLEGARAALSGGRDGGYRFVLVQQGVGAASFARTLHLELPKLITCVVDAPFDHPRAAEWVVAEAMAASRYTEAHYDGDGRRREPVLRHLELQPHEASAPHPNPLRPGEREYVSSFGVLQRNAMPVRLPDSREQAPSPSTGEGGDEGEASHQSRVGRPLSSSDVLLVTGGGKGIAAECALRLARETGARLALIGRSQPSADAELEANLKRLDAAGVEYRYISADVTDEGAVRAAVQQAEASLGPITAFLHGAGTNAPRLISDLDEDAFLRTLAPKIQGAHNVLAAVNPDNLRLFIAFGSVIARTGMRGEADYGLANEWLTRLAERYQAEHPACRCISVEWSVWSGVGMGERLGRVDALARQGIAPIPPDEGVAMLRRLIARPGPCVAVVVTGRFGETPTLKLDRPELPLLRFLEQSRVYYPGVELVVDSDVSTSTDRYLDDHVFQGERILPGVMGLEAIAQAAMALVGAEKPPAFEDVKFLRPVVASPESPVKIRVAALVREPGRVQVALRSDRTGFQVDHIQAVCRFGDEGRKTKDDRQFDEEELPIVPERDLYGNILFHSGRFVRLRGYRRLRARECIAELSPDGAMDWFAHYIPGTFVLGDPGARDAAIHAIQACIPHATLLPIGIKRLTLSISRPLVPRFVHARETLREGSTFTYDVTVTSAEGDVVEQWEGLQLRTVSATRHRDGWAEPLLGPYVERRVEELIAGAEVSVDVSFGLNGGRRSAGDKVVQRMLGADTLVHRRPDGKPELSGNGRLNVSLAHCGELTLAVAAPGPVGCDLEAVKARPASVWSDLLGPEGFKLAQLIAREQGEDQDTAATRVWAAAESLKKAGGMVNTPLAFVSAEGDGWVKLSAGQLEAVTYATRTRGAEGTLVLAVLARGDHARL